MSDAGNRLAGRSALITGSSGAVGRAIALSLAAEGARIALVGRRMDALEETANRVPPGRPRPACHQADLSSDEAIARVAADITKTFEALDILVHSAGVISVEPIECADVKALDAQYAVNLRAPYAMTQTLLPLLKSSRGQVVFINSSVGLRAKGGVTPYAATKHGLKAIADGLREEVNRDGIRVLSVFLGRTAGDMQRRVHAREGRAYREERLIQPSDVASVVLAALCLNRTAEVTDITIRPAAPSAAPTAGGKE